MICKNCNNSTPDTSNFCINCGCPLVPPIPSPTKKPKKLFVVILCIILAALIGVGSAVAYFFMKDDSIPFDEQIVLGYNLIDEGEYEDAIIEFDKAIKIEPKKPEGYIGKAKAKTHNNDPAEEVIEVINLGIENCGDDFGDVKSIFEDIKFIYEENGNDNSANEIMEEMEKYKTDKSKGDDNDGKNNNTADNDNEEKSNNPSDNSNQDDNADNDDNDVKDNNTADNGNEEKNNNPSDNGNQDDNADNDDNDEKNNNTADNGNQDENSTTDDNSGEKHDDVSINTDDIYARINKYASTLGKNKSDVLANYSNIEEIGTLNGGITYDVFVYDADSNQYFDFSFYNNEKCISTSFPAKLVFSNMKGKHSYKTFEQIFGCKGEYYDGSETASGWTYSCGNYTIKLSNDEDYEYIDVDESWCFIYKVDVLD